jgi:hypothetical protein
VPNSSLRNNRSPTLQYHILWSPVLPKLRFPVVSRDFDKPAAFLVPAAFLAALPTACKTENITVVFEIRNLQFLSDVVND